MVKDPFDPNPRPLDKATNGFIRCPECETVVQLPHECEPAVDERPAMFKALTPDEIDVCIRLGAAEVDANLEYATGRWSAEPGQGGPAMARLREVRAEHAKLFRDLVLERAEFAESLLCALAFDHGRLCMLGVWWPEGRPCSKEQACVFCEAAR